MPFLRSAMVQAGAIAICTILLKSAWKAPLRPTTTSRARVVRTGTSSVSTSAWQPAAWARRTRSKPMA